MYRHWYVRMRRVLSRFDLYVVYNIPSEIAIAILKKEMETNFLCILGRFNKKISSPKYNC